MSQLTVIEDSDGTAQLELLEISFVSTCEYGHDFDVHCNGVVVAKVSEDVWSDKSCWDVVIGQELCSFCSKEEAFEFVRSQFTETHKQVQIKLERYLDQQAEWLAPEFEVDSDVDPEFGELFRVFGKGWRPSIYPYARGPG